LHYEFIVAQVHVDVYGRQKRELPKEKEQENYIKN
jgi:hypothetical protein